MNYLCHLYLSEDDPLARLGNLAGDFVKGPLTGRYHPALERGLAQHRRLDAFAHSNPAFNRSRARLSEAVGRYRGVLVDIFYDHLLARHWPHFSPHTLEDFAAGIYADLQLYDLLLPAELRRIAPKMIARNWLVSYRDLATVDLVLRRMAGRNPRHTLLAGSAQELQHQSSGLEEDFFLFMAGAQRWLHADEGVPPQVVR